MTRARNVANILKQPFTNTLGTSNYRAGVNAGDALASGGEKNVFVGDEAGTSITTSDKNVGIGFEALKTDTLGTASVAVGHGALSTQNFTSAAQTFNVAIGFNSGTSITTGNKNTLIGNETGDALTTGNTNVALGNRALTTDTLGDHAVAIGDNALATQNFTSSTDNYNVAIGSIAGNAITTGIYNTFVGGLAGDAQTVADNNTAVGFEALSTNTNGSGSVAIGFRALKTQNYGSATDSLNVAVGNASGTAVTTGTKNTLIGHATGQNQTDAGNNTFIGHKAGNAETRGHNSVAVGSNALLVQNTTSNTSIDNTAVGYNVGKAVTTGVKNTLIGSGTGDGITTGDRNTALGYRTLSGAVDDGQYNTCVGSDAGLVTTGDQNTFVGSYDPSTGGSGAEVTSGSKNTILGAFNGNQSNLDIRTSSNNIVLSDGDGFPDFYKTMTVGTNGTWFTGNRTATAYWPHTSTGNALNGISLQGESGTVGISSNALPLYINRNTDDGGLIYFYGTGNNEGNISVSGTTVSYNGGHLSRWSQLSDGSKDTTIVKGTVMTNLDQMAVWKHKAVKVGDDEYSETGQLIGKATEAKDAYTEDNEQLNCMAVSSVEGDVNVAGVFVNWDYIDDGFNDMNIAMTGDMVIRIAKGTTVARGDLLMSAGDGTAKPQGDDIVRSKTIAKVTSTNVSHTYDDGTYLVPCVLMAC